MTDTNDGTITFRVRTFHQSDINAVYKFARTHSIAMDGASVGHRGAFMRLVVPCTAVEAFRELILQTSLMPYPHEQEMEVNKANKDNP